jgi:hypothetical protein
MKLQDICNERARVSTKFVRPRRAARRRAADSRDEGEGDGGDQDGRRAAHRAARCEWVGIYVGVKLGAGGVAGEGLVSRDVVLLSESGRTGGISRQARSARTAGQEVSWSGS